MILGMLFLPLLQQNFHLLKFKPLNGYFETVKQADTLKLKSWMDESFQKKYNSYLEDNFGFRELLIRVNNQINYSLFKKTEAKNVVVGKHDCLYEEGYILDYTGYTFLGTRFWDELLRRTKLVQDTLKKAHNTSLILVLEPGKASFYPEYIPNRYGARQKTVSNMDYLSEQTQKRGLVHLDLNRWFCAMKDTARYSLYATYGVHWSTFGMYKAADTLARFIEQLRHIDMPEMKWNAYTVTNKLKDTDFDIEASLNLLWELPHLDMCYPQISYVTKPNKTKPKLLTIGDSYYWAFISNQIVDSMYSQHQYWYYFTGIWPDIWTSKNIASELNLQQELEKQDVILLAMTELNAFYGFWGFVEAAHRIYYPNETNADFDATKELMLKDMYFKRHHALAAKYRCTVQQIIDTELKNKDRVKHWLR
ncbi:MAG: hypothetical protein WCQ95_14310 [Bacteroidota bacterium]